MGSRWSVGYSQQENSVGMYMLFPEVYNPSVVGGDNLMTLAGLHRRAFVGINGAPVTTYACASMPFHILKTAHGTGVRFTDDRIGFYTTQSLHIQYAYHHTLSVGRLDVGVELGYVNVRFNADSSNLGDFSDGMHSGSDPVLEGEKRLSGMKFDMGVGIYFVARKYYVGFGLQHLTFPRVEWSEKSSYKLRGLMTLTGGYHWLLKHPLWTLEPSMMLLTDFRDYYIEPSLRVFYRSKYSIGVSYRIAAAVGLHVGIEVIDGLKVGYVYEMPTSKLMRASGGTHEVYLSYGLELWRGKNHNRYKSIRYL